MKRLHIILTFTLALIGACHDQFEEETPVLEKIRVLDRLTLDPITGVLVEFTYCCGVNFPCLNYCVEDLKRTNEAGIVEARSPTGRISFSHNSYVSFISDPPQGSRGTGDRCYGNQKYKNSDGISDFCLYPKADLRISINGDMNNDTTDFVRIYAYYTPSKLNDGDGIHYLFGSDKPYVTLAFLAGWGDPSLIPRNFDVQNDLRINKDGIGDYYLNVRVEYFTREVDYGGRQTHIKELPQLFTPRDQLTEFSIQL